MSIQVNVYLVPFESVQLQLCVDLGLSGEDLGLKNTPEARSQLVTPQSASWGSEAPQLPPSTSVPEHPGRESCLESGNAPRSAGVPLWSQSTFSTVLPVTLTGS